MSVLPHDIVFLVYTRVRNSHDRCALRLCFPWLPLTDRDLNARQLSHALRRRPRPSHGSVVLRVTEDKCYRIHSMYSGYQSTRLAPTAVVELEECNVWASWNDRYSAPVDHAQLHALPAHVRELYVVQAHMPYTRVRCWLNDMVVFRRDCAQHVWSTFA
jgi:hypothetical protein